MFAALFPYRGTREPTLAMFLVVPRIDCKDSKNARRVFSNPAKTRGIRNLNMIMASPKPKTLSIFILVSMRKARL